MRPLTQEQKEERARRREEAMALEAEARRRFPKAYLLAYESSRWNRPANPEHFVALHMEGGNEQLRIGIRKRGEWVKESECPTVEYFDFDLELDDAAELIRALVTRYNEAIRELNETVRIRPEPAEPVEELVEAIDESSQGAVPRAVVRVDAGAAEA